VYCLLFLRHCFSGTYSITIGATSATTCLVCPERNFCPPGSHIPRPCGSFTTFSTCGPRANANAMVFTGVNYVTVVSNPGFLAYNGGGIEAWIRTTASISSGWMGIANRQTSYGMSLFNGRLSVIDMTNQVVTTAGPLLNDGSWHHVAFFFQSGAVAGSSLFVDGVLVAAFTFGVATPNANFGVGCYGGPAGNGNFIGQIADVRVWQPSFMRTAAQITANMCARLASNTVGLGAYYYLDGTAPVTVNSQVASVVAGTAPMVVTIAAATFSPVLSYGSVPGSLVLVYFFIFISVLTWFWFLFSRILLSTWFISTNYLPCQFLLSQLFCNTCCVRVAVPNIFACWFV
jgi:hypothetical protein